MGIDTASRLGFSKRPLRCGTESMCKHIPEHAVHRQSPAHQWHHQELYKHPTSLWKVHSSHGAGCVPGKPHSQSLLVSPSWNGHTGGGHSGHKTCSKCCSMCPRMLDDLPTAKGPRSIPASPLPCNPLQSCPSSLPATALQSPSQKHPKEKRSQTPNGPECALWEHGHLCPSRGNTGHGYPHWGGFAEPQPGPAAQIAACAGAGMGSVASN